MRSVVVVLPASMWAMMPIFRVLSSEYCRSTSSSAFFLSTYMRRGGPGCGPPLRRIPLPAVMRERFVGLRHLVRVFPLLHGGAAVVGGVQQLGRELLGHAALRARPRPPAASGASALRRLRAVLRAALLASGHAGGVERSADDVIADAWQVLHAAAADHHDGVLLEVVPHAGDVRGDLQPVREPHARHLAEGGVRLLGRGRVDADAHAPLLRARLHRGRLRLLAHRFPTVANELINRRHGSPSPHTATKLSLYNRTTPACQSWSALSQQRRPCRRPPASPSAADRS